MAANGAGNSTSYDGDEALQKYQDIYGFVEFVDPNIVETHSRYQAKIKEVEEVKVVTKEKQDAIGANKSKVIPITKWDEFGAIKKHLEQNPGWEGAIQVVANKNAEGQRLKYRIDEALGSKFGSRVEVFVTVDKY